MWLSQFDFLQARHKELAVYRCRQGGVEKCCNLFDHLIHSSCRSFGTELYEYLADVLNRLPAMKTSELGALLPDQWVKARKV